nr:putative RNA-dependent RNA polymerase [Rhizoctonia solani mitovirus 113]
MAITLFLLSAFLGVVRYFHLSDLLATPVTQSPEVYLAFAVLVVFIRLGIALCKLYPKVRRFFASLGRLVETSDGILDSTSPRDKDAPVKESPFKTGARRQLHTVASRRAGTPKTAGRREQPPHILDMRGVGNPNYISRFKAFELGSPSSKPRRSSGIAAGHPKSIYHSALLRSRFNPDKVLDYLRVKAGAAIVAHLKGISLFAGAIHTVSTVRQLLTFARVCSHILATQGRKGLVLFLKTSTVMLQQSLGGHVTHSLTSLGPRVSRTKAGLPRFLNAQYRMRIRAGETAAIRLALTLVNLYRVIKYPGNLSWDTIIKENSGDNTIVPYLQGMIPLFVSLFVSARFSAGRIHRILYRAAKNAIFPMFKGGPGVTGFMGEFNTHPTVMLRQLLTLRSLPGLWESFTILLYQFRSYQVIDLVNWVVPLRNITGTIPLVGKSFDKPRQIKLLRGLGKLGTKEEAAGKVRLFAMVDAWTQWALYPLHELIFKLLESVPMDGTFDQTAPLKHVRPISGFWSLDLSAATDRLPLSIQKSLIGAIIGRESAAAWANLLTGRTYALRTEDHNGNATVHRLHYAVGQPMGALSSWASLALTHHFLVQCAAWSAGYPKWKLYTNYAVLGDDVVIGDAKVARAYLRIMESLGVKVNTSKSLLSHRGLAFEFAKRTVVRGVDVSPVTFKEYYSATRSIGAFLQLMKRTQTPFARALQALGVGWKVRSWLNKPIGKLSARLRLLILAANVPKTPEEATAFFKLGLAPVRRYAHDTQLVIQQFVDREVSRIFEKLHQLAPLSLGGSVSGAWAADLAEGICREDLGLDLKGIVLPWPENDSWWSWFSLEDIQWGTTRGTVREVAYRLYMIIHSIRVMQTRHFKVDLNSLMTRCFVLMSGSHSLTFSEVYTEYLAIVKEYYNFSTTVLATTRPQEPGIKGILTPSQVRLWKRWSAVLQGSSPLLDSSGHEVSAKTTQPVVELSSELPNVGNSVPSVLGEPVGTPFDEYHAYVWFHKAGVHEGYDYRWGIWPLYRGISSVDGKRVS